MNHTPQADLDRLHDELPIMWGEQPAACRKLSISRSALGRRLKLLEARGLAVSIGTGWIATSDSWIEEET